MITKSPAIFTFFEEVTDPRQAAKVEYPLIEMITIAMCASICGVNDWQNVERFAKMKEDWFRKFLKLEYGIPSHDTFTRVFARLDTEEMYQCLQQWISSLQLTLQDQGVHIDGKVIRRSFDNSNNASPLQIVSAWASEQSLCLGQIAVEEDSNEITAVPKLLDLLELTGAVVTLDAMHCQTKTAKKIREKGADYILPVKKNQLSLQHRIKDIFEAYGEDDYRDKKVRICQTNETNRGRREFRKHTVAPAPKDIRQRGWTDAKSIGMVYRVRECDGKTSEELIYFVSSLPPKVRMLAKHLRSHWTVENQLHWSLDVTFSEDESRIRKGNGQEIACLFRRISLSMLKQNKSIRASLRGKRLMAGWNSDLLEDILAGK